MQSWLAKRIVTRNMARVRAGDYRPQLRLAAIGELDRPVGPHIASAA